MSIARQRFAKASRLHDRKTDAIGEWPGLVVAIGKQIQSGLEPMERIGHDFNGRILEYFANEACGAPSRRRTRECVGNFNEYPMRGHETKPKVARYCDCPRVVLIALV